MTFFEWAEFLSYVVTVVGLPFAIAAYLIDNRRERQNEEEELNQRLADEYTNFLKLVLDNSDLQLLRSGGGFEYSDDQKERRLALFGILTALFERVYIMMYDDDMNKQTKRMWLSWEDYMREWCRRRDYRYALPKLLEGEDPDFSEHIRRIAKEEELGVGPGGSGVM